MASYQIAPLDFKTMTSLYLYGQLTPPNRYNDRIRPPDGSGDVTVVDGTAFGLLSNAGPGRFATPALAPFVQTFFTSLGTMPASVQALYATKLAAQGGTGPVSITVKELVDQAGIPPGQFRFNFEQRGYDSGSGDYGARTYIYNAELFRLSDTTTFVFDPNNSDPNANYLTNVQVRPFDDNFDFTSISGGFAQLGNSLYLTPRIDPYNLGKTVDILFNNRAGPGNLHRAISGVSA